MRSDTWADLDRIKARKMNRLAGALEHLREGVEFSQIEVKEGILPRRLLAGPAFRADELAAQLGLLGEIREVLDADVAESLASEALREKDAKDYPHDEDCPRCGRRQWGLSPLTVDEMNPTDEEQNTCGACGYTFGEDV